MTSAIYTGSVRHRRKDSRARQFTYQVFMVYLDLEQYQKVFDQTPWWSYRRFSLAWFRAKDYLEGTNEPLLDQVKRKVLEQTGACVSGPVRMLTNLRYFGFLINPITCYYCFDANGKHIEFIVAEVTNTPWRNRIQYVLDVRNQTGSKQRAVFEKAMHVSPFQPMNMVYHWYSNTPSKQLLIHLDVKSNKASQFDATLRLTENPMSASVLNKTIARYPFMTIKVFLAIYWQAVKLVIRRAPFYSNPH